MSSVYRVCHVICQEVENDGGKRRGVRRRRRRKEEKEGGKERERVHSLTCFGEVSSRILDEERERDENERQEGGEQPRQAPPVSRLFTIRVQTAVHKLVRRVIFQLAFHRLFDLT